MLYMFLRNTSLIIRILDTMKNGAEARDIRDNMLTAESQVTFAQPYTDWGARVNAVVWGTAVQAGR